MGLYKASDIAIRLENPSVLAQDAINLGISHEAKRRHGVPRRKKSNRQPCGCSAFQKQTKFFAEECDARHRPSHTSAERMMHNILTR